MNDLNLFGEQVIDDTITHCLYSKCGKPLSAEKIKNGAKHCNNICKCARYREEETDRKKISAWKIWEAFYVFIESHPCIFNTFVKMSLKAQSSGVKIGGRAIIEVMRWNLNIEKIEINGEKPKMVTLKNDFNPCYTRLAAHRFPQLKGYFNEAVYLKHNDEDFHIYCMKKLEE